MRLEEYRILFAAIILASILISAAPALSMVITLPSGIQRFSELWVLDPTRMMENYPFNVRVNETYSVFVGLGNHIGHLAYYCLYVKFRNQTQPLPDSSKSTPSSLSPLYEFRSLVADGAIWEAPLTFTFLEGSRLNDSYSVDRVSINDVVLPVNCPSRWDLERSGFYFQLFLELWLYDTSLQRFQYYDRFVGIWLNMTT